MAWISWGEGSRWGRVHTSVGVYECVGAVICVAPHHHAESTGALMINQKMMSPMWAGKIDFYCPCGHKPNMGTLQAK